MSILCGTQTPVHNVTIPDPLLCLANGGLMLANRLRRWHSIKPEFGECLLLPTMEDRVI